MSKLNLVLNGNFDENVIKTVNTQLNEHLRVGKPRYYLTESADQVLISAIGLIGDFAAWLPLGVAATVYISRLSARAADATWDGLASLFKDKKLKPIVDIATALATVANSVDGKVKIEFKINFAVNQFGVAKTCKARDPEDVARVFSSLVANAEQLSTATQSVIDELHGPPPGGVYVELQVDGSWLITWLDPDNCILCKRRITLG